MGTKDYLKIPKLAKNIVLVFPLVVILNILAAGLWASLLHDCCFCRPQTLMICDLLFLEGAIIFAIGAFLESGIAWPLKVLRHSRERHPAGEKTDNGNGKSSKKKVRKGMFMIILGAMLIGSSVAVGQLLL
jgi:hypothetical protein